jgi:leucyl aminopeptidase
MSSLVSFIDKKPWLISSLGKATGKSQGAAGHLYFIGREEKLPSVVTKAAPKWVKDKIKAGQSIVSWSSSKGPVWLISTRIVESGHHYGLFSPSAYSMARDLVGSCFRQVINEKLKSLTVEHCGKSEEEFKGLCAGLEIAQYSFSNYWPKYDPINLKITFKTKIKDYKTIMKAGAELGQSVNLSRYLVDLPPNELNPKTYASTIKSIFTGVAKTKVTVWDNARLKKEKMGLHIAVGQAAEESSRLVHIQYRNGGTQKSVAFVGKGITFDSGGLDIKPASGMRNMKKDMGGSASVAGIAYWVSQARPKMNCDFYFAMAENAVSKESFRPGDILKARNGKTVEIHNTDAEGRLVLADALTVATESKPELVIDVATLTGAIKYGLGAGTPGLFSNSDNLAETLLRSGQNMGDVVWRMPLVPEEKGRLRSDVADIVNCTDGYGGAITAALFLEMFTNKVPWAHLDIYAWNDRAKGACREKGGSGQIVQMMSEFLSHYQT